ncbi:hypothetical protein A2U01_0092198, partial [Trifolium medium]|nr:hypothetical protein [Trifolium medium]
SGELASAARIVDVAGEDSSWHMLSGELAYFGSFAVVVGVDIVAPEYRVVKVSFG